MEINITEFFNTERPRDYSASVAEIGANAGRYTWQAAMERAQDDPVFLDTEEKLYTMRQFAKSSGGWNAEEIAAWSAQEVNALFIQWLSGDMRECGFDKGASWEDVEQRQQAGQAPSNLFKGTDGQVYFYLGH